MGRKQLESPGNLCCRGGVVWCVADIHGVCITAPTTKLLYSCRRQASCGCSYSEDSSLGHSCSGATDNVGWTVAFGLTAACQTGSGIMEQLAWHDSTLSRMAWRGLDSRLERVSPIVMMDPFPNWSILEYLMVSCRS